MTSAFAFLRRLAAHGRTVAASAAPHSDASAQYSAEQAFDLRLQRLSAMQRGSVARNVLFRTQSARSEA